MNSLINRANAWRNLSALSVLLLVGCPARQTPPAPVDQKTKDQIAAIAAGKTANVPPDSSPGASPGTSPFTHEIDRLPEGLKFREATRALDRGDVKAVEVIQKELAASPKYSALAQAIQGLVLIREGKFDEAIGIAEDISAIPVMQAESYVIAGEVFQRQNRLSEALAAFQNAVAINPQHVRAQRWLGVVYYDTGSMRLATRHLRIVGELDPHDVNSLLLSAKINQEYEQYEEALRDYREVSIRKLDENLKIFVAVKQAECLCVLRKLDEARQVLAACPTTPAVVATQATIAESEGQFERAVELAKDALAHSANQRTAALVLGRVYVTERQWLPAVEVLEPLVKSAPFDHEPRLLYGRALMGKGDNEHGQQEIKRATELKDDVLKFAKLHESAMAQPEDAQLRFELGQMAEKLGKTQLARSWYTAALGLSPDLAGARTALNRLDSHP